MKKDIKLKEDPKKKKYLVWIFLFILLMFFLFISRFLSPIFYLNFFPNQDKQDLPQLLSGASEKYIINEIDYTNHTKNFSGNVVMKWETKITSIGAPVGKSSDWKTDWRIDCKQEGKVKTTFSIPGVNIPPTEERVNSTYAFELSLKNLKEGGSTTKGNTKVTLLKDNGKDGALIQIDFVLTPEQQKEIDRMDQATANSVLEGWGATATTMPPTQLLIRNPDSPVPTPQNIK